MSKHKKKRTKKYQGVDAKVSTPQVMRVSAEERSRFKEWWLVYGQLTRFVSIALAILVVVVLLVIGIVGMFQR